MTQMTKREAAIVSAYTGILIGDFTDMLEYISELMGKPIYTHELPSIYNEIKEKSFKDFCRIEVCG